MNKRKRVGPRIEPCETPSLIANSGDHLSSKTTSSLRPLQKEEIIWKMSSVTPYAFSLWSRPLLCQTLSKALEMSKATAQMASDKFKVLAILSVTTVRRSAVDLDDPKPYWKSEKRPTLEVPNQFIIDELFNDLIIHRK